MAPTNPHRGISIKQLKGGRYRLRWREREQDGTTTAQSWTVALADEAAAVEAAIKIRRALDTEGTFTRPTDPKYLHRPQVADLQGIFLDYLRWRKGRVKTSTIKMDKIAVKSFVAAIREIEGIPKGEEIPCDLLTEDLFRAVVEGWQASLADRSVSLYAGSVFQAWEWASDGDYDGLRGSPRKSSRVLPRSAPTRSHAPLAPSWHDLDDAIQGMRAGKSKTVATILRFTGLRISQVLSLTVRDYNPARQTLRIRTGKVQHEIGREIPVAPPLARFVEGLIAGKDLDAQIAPGTKNAVTRSIASALTASRVPPEAWRSIDGRGNRRVSHCFRAAFQSEMMRLQAPSEHIDMLVGHAGGSIRSRAYAAPSLQALRATVSLIPALGASEASPDNVVAFPAAQRASESV